MDMALLLRAGPLFGPILIDGLIVDSLANGSAGGAEWRASRIAVFLCQCFHGQAFFQVSDGREKGFAAKRLRDFAKSLRMREQLAGERDTGVIGGKIGETETAWPEGVLQFFGDAQEFRRLGAHGRG